MHQYMTTFNTSREIAAPIDDVFAAFSDQDRLARWWGPTGFTNTFHVCEFETGGRWVYTMHSPNGGNPENESTFELVEPPRKVVVRHISQPLYRLTIDLLPTAAGGTIVSWSQEFDDAEVARRIEKVVVPANEQNLDRLTAEVLKTPVEETQIRYYHGTKADLRPGDLIEAGYSSNYGKRQKAGWVYFAATLEASTWGAELAAGEGRGRIYVVEPTRPFEDDPNLTNKRFRGNPTRSYRTRDPLRVTGEVADWKGHTPEQLKQMKDRLAELARKGIEATDD
jgi:uncharacterized protein YndB with AHSA1/START domain